MKKIVFGIGTICLLSSIGTSVFIPKTAHKKTETYVYICNSTGATKYHYTKTCKGLDNCQHEILKVTLREAALKGKKTLCGWEANK